MLALIAACLLAGTAAAAAEGPNSSILRSARGTLEYRKLDSRLAVVAQTPQGTMTQQREVPERFAFIPHPPAANAWQIGAYHRARGGVHQVPLQDLQTRLAGPGNLFGPLNPVAIEFLGVERGTVPAGAFEADHFRSGESEIWVRGPDAIILRFLWKAVGEEYVLTLLVAGKQGGTRVRVSAAPPRRRP